MGQDQVQCTELATVYFRVSSAEALQIKILIH